MDERETSGKTPQELTEKIIDICNTNKISNLFYVPKQPKDDCEAGNCFSNVEKYVKKFGGNLLMGWSITIRTNLFIEAEAHAVWQTSDNEIVDITPNNEDCNQTLFSHQKDMQAIKTPSKYIPLTLSNLVQEYVNLRNEFERIRCSTIGDTLQIPKPLMDRIIEIDNIFLLQVGRNDKCPCESGLKYKRCCGK
jgi:Predicted metal-binding protein related to the C-terminal domain of SecA